MIVQGGNSHIKGKEHLKVHMIHLLSRKFQNKNELVNRQF